MVTMDKATQAAFRATAFPGICRIVVWRLGERGGGGALEGKGTSLSGMS